MSVEIPQQYEWNSEPGVLVKPTLEQLLSVEIDDEGLRDGLHGVPIHPSVDEAKRYIDMASEIGIEAMTVGIFTPEETLPNKVTRKILAYMSEKHPGTIPIVLARPVKEDLQFARECAGINGKTEIIVFQGTSPWRLWVQGWEGQEVLTGLGEGIEQLALRDIPTIAFTEDTTRTPPEFLKQFIGVAVNSGARRLGIADTTGHLDPWGAYRISKSVRQMLDSYGEEGKKIGLDFHAHRDRGFALPDTLAAISAGADRVHAVILGAGERSGNAPMHTIMYNVNRFIREAGYPDDKWNLQLMLELALQYADMTGILIPDHTPLLGPNAFSTKIGIHADAQEKAIMKAIELTSGEITEEQKPIIRQLNEIAQCIYTSVPPDTVGRVHDYKIGPTSGKASVRMWLYFNGYEVKLGDYTDSRIELLLQKADEQGRVLEKGEIAELIGPPTKDEKP